MPPKLIITRPASTADRFAKDVQSALGRDVDCVFSPAYKIVFLPFEIAKAPEAYVFTSANGVAAAARAGLSGTAWCVGDRTTQIAQEAGFDATSAQGDVEDLYRVILETRPKGALLHIAGQHTRGELAQRLVQQGIQISVITAYDQPILAPSEQFTLASNGSDPLVIPLFSARAAFILSVSETKAPVHVVAMSQAIGSAAIDLSADTVVVTKMPNYRDMVTMTCHRFEQLDQSAG